MIKLATLAEDFKKSKQSINLLDKLLEKNKKREIELLLILFDISQNKAPTEEIFI